MIDRLRRKIYYIEITPKIQMPEWGNVMPRLIYVLHPNCDPDKRWQVYHGQHWYAFHATFDEAARFWWAEFWFSLTHFVKWARKRETFSDGTKKDSKTNPNPMNPED